MNKEWFSNWFDSEYYHILYQHRDDLEAQRFIHNLIKFLKVNTGAKALDLACGKGRHSIYLSKMGLDVVGMDLSLQSINHAKQYEHDNLRFECKDMRAPLERKYDFIFNLFTSFGYFEDNEDDLKVLQNMSSGLKDKNSRIIIDFINARKAIDQLKCKETQHLNGIDFNIKRSVRNFFIQKNIQFEDNGSYFDHTERVRAYFLEDFESMFDQVGLILENCFGNYSLGPYDQKNTDRLIMIARLK